MKEKIEQAIIEIIKSLGLICEEKIIVDIPGLKENGDYTSNVALKLANKNNMKPMDLAELIKNQFSLKEVNKIEIKAPGFINFFVDNSYLFNNIDKILTEKETYGSNNDGQGKKINIEFVSANPTGIVHMGNARGGAYGDNLARIYSFNGYQVNKEYYVNDSGNQIANLGKSLKTRYLEVCGVEASMPEDGYFGEDIKELANELYEQEKNKLVEANYDFFEEYATKKLLDKIIADLKEYRVTYDTLTSERAIKKTNYIETVLKEYKEKEYIYEKEGATWFKGTSFGAPRDFVLIKSDGNYTYVLPDVAHHLNTLNFNYDKLINVLGADHHGYVPVIKSTLKALGKDTNIIDIKLLQLVKVVKDGKEFRMSKRAGNAITLKQLLDEVGVNAARYFFASRSLDTQMDFDLDLAKKESNENPVFYICYAYARICSVLKDSILPTEKLSYQNINNDEVNRLLEKIYLFPTIVKDAANKEIPHLIANYAYELANLFHAYYSKHRILTENEEETKESLNLIQATKIVLNNALNLIGVIPPEKM